MTRKIVGVTVGTPISPQSIKKILKPVTSVNGVKADENGNVTVSGSSLNTIIEGETLVFTSGTIATIENETLIL